MSRKLSFISPTITILTIVFLPRIRYPKPSLCRCLHDM